MRGTPLVFDIARGSGVDGPGLRTTVFFKGCPLRCIWCHNPEGQRFSQEIGFSANRCLGCGSCKEACPAGAIDLGSAGRVQRSACAADTGCGTCADACDSLALCRIGKTYSEDELLALILRDLTFFRVSGGGVTFSGGEPLVHLGFLGGLARRLQEKRVHVTIETCGHFDYSRFRRELLPWVDCILFDLKIIDSTAHRRLTGRDNKRILENFAALAGEEGVICEEESPSRKVGRFRDRRSTRPRHTVLTPRIPLIPELTTTRDNLKRIAELLHSLGIRSYVLLPYNPPGLGKWNQLGRTPRARIGDQPMSLALEEKIRAEFADLMSPPARSDDPLDALSARWRPCSSRPVADDPDRERVPYSR